MKKSGIAIALLLLTTVVFAQSKARKIPTVDIKTLDGSSFNTSEIANNGNPIILSFWATWCSPCKRELGNIAEVYEEWQEETKVKLIAVSIDDARNTAKVAPYVNGKGWEYEVYLDANSDFKRSMNVNNVPHTFIINGNMEIVWQHTSYAEGDEEEYYEIVKKLISGEEIQH